MINCVKWYKALFLSYFSPKLALQLIHNNFPKQISAIKLGFVFHFIVKALIRENVTP